MNILLQAEMRIVLCYLMASHCNPMAFNLHIPNFVVAFLRVRRWVVHYASMQFRQLLYKQKSNQESWVLKPEVGVSQNSLQVSQMRNLRCALCPFFQRLCNLRLRIGKSNICCALIANFFQDAQSQKKF